jgi:deazaflavin-dependent oxidoreductase (nitroreductase family)
MSTETARRRQLSGIERLGERFAQSKTGSWFYINVAMRVDRALLPLTNGRASISVGQQVGMLETIGAKSGERRRIPLLFIRDGDHVILIASMGGAPRHPSWLHNIRATPGRGRGLLRGLRRVQGPGRQAPDPDRGPRARLAAADAGRLQTEAQHIGRPLVAQRVEPAERAGDRPVAERA